MSSINSGSIVITGAPNVKITNLAITSANTEFSHVLEDNVNVLEFKARPTDNASLKFSFVETESGTNYISVPECSGQSFSNIKLSGKTLYIQSPKTCTIEIIEFYN